MKAQAPPPPGRAPVPPPEARYLPPPPYPPGQPPLPPRPRQPRNTPVIAPVLAFLGLLLVAGASLWGMTFLGTPEEEAEPGTALLAEASPGVDSEPDGSDPDAVDPPVDEATPEPVLARPTTPPLIVEPPPDQRADITGTILFTRGGDIWAASGKELRRLTSNGTDSSPSWTHDGKQIYFVRTSKRTTSKSRGPGLYTLYVPDIWRMNADGSNKKRVYSSLLRGSNGLWFSHVLQPDISPDGKTLAVVSDGPNGAAEDVTLHMVSSKGGRLRKVAVSSFSRLGHNDPEWSRDGKRLAYTRNRNVGSVGMPAVTVLNCKSKRDCTRGKERRLRSGFANPSWSPDGKWLAVEATKGLGRDIAILNVAGGNVRVQLTDDGNSFAPVVSPAGDQIAYLRRNGLAIDLRVMTFDIGEDGSMTMVEDRAVTSDGGIDAHSSPAWYIAKARKSSAPEAASVEATDAADEPAPVASEGPGPLQAP